MKAVRRSWLLLIVAAVPFGTTAALASTTVSVPGKPVTVTFLDPADGTTNVGSHAYNPAAEWSFVQMNLVLRQISTTLSYVQITATPKRSVTYLVLWSDLGNYTGYNVGFTRPFMNTVTGLTSTQEVLRDGLNVAASPEGLDGVIQFNANEAVKWNLSSASPEYDQYDFMSVLNHEMGHMLGLDDSYTDPLSCMYHLGGLGLDWMRRTPDLVLLNKSSGSGGSGGSGGGGGGGWTVYPEPSSLLALGTGLFGLGGLLSRRRVR